LAARFAAALPFVVYGYFLPPTFGITQSFSAVAIFVMPDTTIPSIFGSHFDFIYASIKWLAATTT